MLFVQLTLLMQRLFPTLFQGSRYQAVLRFDALILTRCPLRVIFGPLQTLLPMLVKTLSLPLDVLIVLKAAGEEIEDIIGVEAKDALGQDQAIGAGGHVHRG